MLSKQSRLDRKKIESFFNSQYKTYKGKILTLKFRKNNSKKNNWAFIVSSSIKKNAVSRNKVRRRMSNIAENIQNTTNNGFDFVFITRLNTKIAPSFKILRDDMIQLLKLCGVLY